MIPRELNAHNQGGMEKRRLAPSFGFLAAESAHFLAGRVDFLTGCSASLAVVVGIPLLAGVE